MSPFTLISPLQGSLILGTCSAKFLDTGRNREISRVLTT